MSGQATLTSASAADHAAWNKLLAETVGRRAVANLNRGMSNSAVLIDAVDNFGFLTIHQITSLWTWITTEGGGCERQLRALEARDHDRQREVDLSLHYAPMYDWPGREEAAAAALDNAQYDSEWARTH